MAWQSTSKTRGLFLSTWCLVALAIALVPLLVSLVLWPLRPNRAAKPQAKQASGDAYGYRKLRDAAFRISRSKVDLPARSDTTEAWGVIMDSRFDGGNGTVVAFADGRFNVFLTDPGCLEKAEPFRSVREGAGRYQSDHDAAMKMCEAAVGCQRWAHPTKNYPLPERGEATFYFLTDSGIPGGAASEQALSNGSHTLAKIAEAGRSIMSHSGCSGALPR